MRIQNIVCLVACCLVAACGSPDPGPDGSAGSDGANGSDGQSGASGTPGAPGAAGATGEQGTAGTAGDLLCGDTLIPASEYHTVCGSSVGSCRSGQVQCRASLSDGELALSRVCYGEVKPAANSGRCDTDADCDGVADDTAGAGDNVTLTDRGRCRNAAKHCLLPDGDTCLADANGEGVLWSDFVAAANEADIGLECVSGSEVRSLECTVSAAGVASVTCTGPRSAQ